MSNMPTTTNHRTVWIKQSDHSRDDRSLNGWGVGDAVWCPQTRTNGDSLVYYDNATQVQRGDVIVHLDQNQHAFTAISRAADSHEETTCPVGTKWDRKGNQKRGYTQGQRPAYRVPLSSHYTFPAAVDVEDVFAEENEEILQKLRENNSVVYTRQRD